MRLQAFFLVAAALSAPASVEQYTGVMVNLYTWSGRGRKPEWLHEGTASGKSLDEYLIK